MAATASIVSIQLTDLHGQDIQIQYSPWLFLYLFYCLNSKSGDIVFPLVKKNPMCRAKPTCKYCVWIQSPVYIIPLINMSMSHTALGDMLLGYYAYTLLILIQSHIHCSSEGTNELRESQKLFIYSIMFLGYYRIAFSSKEGPAAGLLPAEPHYTCSRLHPIGLNFKEVISWEKPSVWWLNACVLDMTKVRTVRVVMNLNQATAFPECRKMLFCYLLRERPHPPDPPDHCLPWPLQWNFSSCDCVDAVAY